MTTYRIWGLVLAGIIAISSASILIRITDAPALTIAAYRMAISSILLVIPGIWNLVKLKIKFSRIYPAMLSGMLLAAHFGFWITSLSYTTVASSVILVNTAPIFVALMSTKFLKEKPAGIFWAGLVLTLSGSIVLTRLDFSVSKNHAIGDLLAICGALALSGYLLLGRYILKKLPFVVYIFMAYTTGAVLMLSICFLSGIKLTGFPANTLFKFFLIAAVPQFIGHSIFNWSLKFLPASIVSLLILGEPIGASLLAYFILGEVIPTRQALSLVLICSGIVVGSLSIPGQAKTEPK